MRDITIEMENEIDEAIIKIIDWLNENRSEYDVITTNYNYDYRDRKYKDTIRVSPRGEIESGNLWGYHTNWKSLYKLLPCEKLEIIEQWKDIKDRFIHKKNEMNDKYESTKRMIIEFEA